MPSALDAAIAAAEREAKLASDQAALRRRQLGITGTAVLAVQKFEAAAPPKPKLVPPPPPEPTPPTPKVEEEAASAEATVRGGNLLQALDRLQASEAEPKPAPPVHQMSLAEWRSMYPGAGSGGVQPPSTTTGVSPWAQPEALSRQPTAALPPGGAEEGVQPPLSGNKRQALMLFIALATLAVVMLHAHATLYKGEPWSEADPIYEVDGNGSNGTWTEETWVEEHSDIDNADTAWMLVSTGAVLLMVPGLGLFEAGLLRAKNAVSVLMQCFSGLAILSLLWVVIGFSLCFAPTDLGLVGGLDYLALDNVGWATSLPNAPTIPGVLFASFQNKFATITPLLCTGAFAERFKFEAYMLFLVLWSFLVYYPLCHWVWGGGWLATQYGVLDFAGGIVIHTSAGAASIVTALMLGPRAEFAAGDTAALTPHNLPMAAIGAGLLWFGWFSFNGGSSLASGALASSTLMTTHTAGSYAVWVLLDWAHTGRPTFVGVINGGIAGLAGVTPASGFVSGLLCGLGSYGGVLLLKEKLGIDDALDVSSMHGVTGVIGSLLLGVYASTDVNPDGADGLLFGGGLDQLWAQVIGVLVALVWASLGTWLVMKIIDGTVGARAPAPILKKGLDVSQHGEDSYHNLQVLV